MISRLWLYIIILLASISAFLCDREFDKAVSTIDTVVEFKFTGYRNRGNRGMTKGCCGERFRGVCQPCRMMVVLYEQSYYYGKSRYVTIQVLSKASEELYEKFEDSLLISSDTYDIIKMMIFTFNSNKTIQEHYPNINTIQYTQYRYDGAFGINNVLELWAQMTLQPRSAVKSYFYAMLRIDAIFFREYRNKDGTCCSGVPDVGCPDECGYYFEWSVGNTYLLSSDDLTPSTRSRLQDISITLVSNDDDLKANNDLTYYIDMYSSFYKPLDSLKITKITILPNAEYRVINRVGVYGNVVFNVTVMHSCNIYGGQNCKNFCSVDLGTEYCDMYTGKTRCLNGASDSNTCVNIVKECKSDTCSTRGSCSVIKGIPTCNCNPGYGGKFCQNWQCDSGCNGNGLCVGPNKCSCYPPNTGTECEEYPCNEDGLKRCGKFGHCKITSGNERCECFNKLLTGVNCTQAICANKCVFGKCLYNIRLGVTNCVCNELYQGISCNITSQNINPKNIVANFAVPIAVIVIVFFILVVLSGLIYKGIVCINFSQFNIFGGNTETLKSTTEA